MEKINELLGYEKIKIIQNHELFHFSLDSVLLAHFATITKKTKLIVDFCTGNAPIPLYLTLRTNKPIIGIEIQPIIYDMAKRSVKLNNLEHQITIMNEDVKNASKIFDNQECDLVICNPPFFKYQEDSNINQKEELTAARHETLLTLEEMLAQASYILNHGGTLALVHRPERLCEIMNLMPKYNLIPKRLQFVYPKKGKKAKHILIEARKTKNIVGLEVLPPLYVYEEDGKWSEDILKIYNNK